MAVIISVVLTLVINDKLSLRQLRAHIAVPTQWQIETNSGGVVVAARLETDLQLFGPHLTVRLPAGTQLQTSNAVGFNPAALTVVSGRVGIIGRELLLSQPIELRLLLPSLPDGTHLQIDSAVLTTDALAQCDADGSIIGEATAALVRDGQMTLYTCYLPAL